MKRLLAFTVLPLIAAAGLVGVSGTQHAAAAAPQQGQGCILGIICFPDGSPSPTPGSPSQSPTASPTGGGPSPTPSPPGGPGPSPTAGRTPPPGPTGSATPTPSASGSASATPSASGTGNPGPKPTQKAVAKRAAAPAGLMASTATSVLTAASANLVHFIYQGIVQMPVAGGGTVTMLKFTADSITMAGDVTDSVTQGGATTVTNSPTLAFSGGITLYATSLSGKLGGIIPLTFTPSTISDILLRFANLLTGALPITLNDVTVDQPLAIAGGLQTGPLSMG